MSLKIGLCIIARCEIENRSLLFALLKNSRNHSFKRSGRDNTSIITCVHVTAPTTTNSLLLHLDVCSRSVERVAEDTLVRIVEFLEVLQQGKKERRKKEERKKEMARRTYRYIQTHTHTTD